MASYSNALPKSNNVTNLSDYRQPKPAGFVDDDTLFYACGRREPDSDFIRRNPGRRFRADTALPHEVEACGLAPLPRGQVAVRLCALNPKLRAAEQPVLLCLFNTDIWRVNEAVLSGNPDDQDQLAVTFRAIRSEYYDQIYNRRGYETIVTPIRCFAADGERWTERTLATPGPRHQPFDYTERKTGIPPKSFHDRVRPFSLTAADVVRLPRRDWIIENMLARGLLSQLVAPGASGKSLLMLQTAVALARGSGDFTAMAVNAPARVLVVNLEDDIFEQHRRLFAIQQHFGIADGELGDRLHLYDPGGEGSSLLIAQRDARRAIIEGAILDELAAYVKQHRIDVVTLDPLVEVHQATESLNEEMAVVMGILKKFARLTDVAVLFAHHTRKPGQASAEGHAGNVDTARGAGAVPNATRVTQTLFGMTAGEAKALGIPDFEKGWYVRLDDAKTNYFLAAACARWFRRTTVNLPNGDDVGVLAPVSFATDRAAECQVVTARLMIAALGAGRQLSPKLRASNSAADYLVENQGAHDFTKQEFGKALALLEGFDFHTETYRSGGKEAHRYALIGQGGRFADGSGSDG